MIYLVTAHFMPERADEYLTKLQARIKAFAQMVVHYNNSVVTVTVWDWYTQITGGGSILDAEQQPLLDYGLLGKRLNTRNRDLLDFFIKVDQFPNGIDI